MIRDGLGWFLDWLDGKQSIFFTGVGLFIFIVLIAFLRLKPVNINELVGVKMGTVEEVNAMLEYTEQFDSIFSLLDEDLVGVGEDTLTYDIKLYLKKPFIDQGTLQRYLSDFIEVYKWKDDGKVQGMRIRLYDRYEVYERDLEPRAYVYYLERLKDGELLYESEGGTRIHGDDVYWGKLLSEADTKKKPDYKDYELVVRGFSPMVLDKSVVPLTDQEFELYLKLDKYRTVMGGGLGLGIKLYLQWDLGKNVYEQGVQVIEKEFSGFMDRHRDLGGQSTYYTNRVQLLQRLAVEKPQFLLFALTSQVEDEPLEAQRKLIEYDADVFLDVLESYVKDQSMDILNDLNELGELDEDGEMQGRDEAYGGG